MESLKNKTVNVLMIIPNLPPAEVGGAERQAIKLSEELTKKNVKIIYLSNLKPGLNPYQKISNCEVYRVGGIPNWIKRFTKVFIREKKDKKDLLNYNQRQLAFGAPLTFVDFVFSIFFILKALPITFRLRKDFDIIHTHSIELVAFQASVLGKIFHKKVLVKDSTMNGIVKVKFIPFVGSFVQSFIKKRCFFVAMTQMIKNNMLQEGITLDKIFKIPNGIKIERSNRVCSSVNTALFVGNLTQQPAKGFDILVKAWALVIRKIEGAKLLVIGTGVTEKYIDVCKSFGIEQNIIFLGKQNNVSNFFNEVNIFILPSRREGMSNALMEAMLYEVPCIATNISGSKDLITHNINGMIVEPEQVEELADQILFLFINKDFAETIGINGRKSILEKFDIKTVGKKYHDTYIKILNENKQKD